MDLSVVEVAVISTSFKLLFVGDSFIIKPSAQFCIVCFIVA